MSNGREWVSMSFCVLNVGPPGFSNVPYTNRKKKGEKETNPLMLYDIVDGNTCFHSFEKGKTNKDKGPRVSQFKETVQVDDVDTEVMRDATTVLESGVMLSISCEKKISARAATRRSTKCSCLTPLSTARRCSRPTPSCICS